MSDLETLGHLRIMLAGLITGILLNEIIPTAWTQAFVIGFGIVIVLWVIGFVVELSEKIRESTIDE